MTLTITDAYPVTVTAPAGLYVLELTEDRHPGVDAAEEQQVTATDPAGNESRLEITVNDGHTWGDWTPAATPPPPRTAD